MVTASFGIEPGRRVEYIPLVEKALELSSHRPSKVLIYNRPNMVRTKHLNLSCGVVSEPAGYVTGWRCNSNMAAICKHDSFSCIAAVGEKVSQG